MHYMTGLWQGFPIFLFLLISITEGSQVFSIFFPEEQQVEKSDFTFSPDIVFLIKIAQVLSCVCVTTIGENKLVQAPFILLGGYKPQNNMYLKNVVKSSYL